VVGFVLAEGPGEPAGLVLPDGAGGEVASAGDGVAGPGVAGRGDLAGPSVGGTQLGAGVGLNTSLQEYVGREAFA
jgi:hypothetical protein